MGPVSRPAPPPAPSPRGFGRGTSSVSARRHRVVWSGTARSSPSRPMTEPIRPSVCRYASRNTALNVSAVRIARSEYSGCPPRLVRRSAFHAATASSKNHTVKLPRRRRLSSYSRQFVTLRFCSGMWRRRSWFSLKGKVGIRGSAGEPPSYSSPAPGATGRIRATTHSRVYGHEEVELALLGSDLGDVDVEVADRIRLEPLLRGLVALGLGQARDAVALQAAVQTGAGQVREGGLERIEAVIQRQKRVPPKGDNHGFLRQGQHGRSRRFQPGRQIGCRRALLPLGDGFRVNPVASGEDSQALLTMLDRATHRRCRAGAPMKNLAHSASLHSGEKSAPSNSGTKRHLGFFQF